MSRKLNVFTKNLQRNFHNFFSHSRDFYFDTLEIKAPSNYWICVDWCDKSRISSFLTRVHCIFSIINASFSVEENFVSG